MSQGQPSHDALRRSATHVLLDESAGELDALEIALPSDLEHHLGRVLRLADGDAVSATDGAGRWVKTTWQPASASLRVVGEVITSERRRPLTIATAMPKGDRLDQLVQKSVELGVARIVLLHAERSVVRWKPERAEKQRIRLQRIADEAVRQSRRLWRVPIAGPVDARTVLPEAVVAEPDGAPLTGEESMVAIGPEGGWTSAELDAAAGTVGLGSGILRVETAAIAVCALRMANGHAAL
ncbi:MAG: 16S rRNA (uracil(1498)-N(3))-methyltransferase [Ilumatobacter sp.]